MTATTATEDPLAKLTTHVLDTARGRPAEGVALALYRLDGNRRTKLAEAQTNADGRTDAPLLDGDAAGAGLYELVFRAGEWLDDQDLPTGFLDEVPVRFRIADAGQHYHVPLLLSPFAYSTYRGS